MTKLLREKYKTYEGASKRARFENSLAPFEFSRGYKARLYRYTVEHIDGAYRVARHTPKSAEAGNDPKASHS